MTSRLIVLLCPLLLAAACSSGQQQTTRRLGDRLQTQLAPDIAAGRAAVQPLPDGARVTLLDPSLFPNTASVLDGREDDVRASVIEGMLDPALMRVQVTDSSGLPDNQRETRVRNVVDYFTAYGLASSLQPVEPLQPPAAGAAPAGLTITIGVQCPQYNDGSGYGTGQSKPTCD
jgi:hypothetical protein